MGFEPPRRPGAEKLAIVSPYFVHFFYREFIRTCRRLSRDVWSYSEGLPYFFSPEDPEVWELFSPIARFIEISLKFPVEKSTRAPLFSLDAGIAFATPRFPTPYLPPPVLLHRPCSAVSSPSFNSMVEVELAFPSVLL